MKYHLKYNRLLIALLLGVGISACKVTKPYQQPGLAGVSQERLFRDTLVTDTTSIANLSWKELFPDTYLQQLIEEGLTHNINLKNALEQINISRASFKESEGAFLPNVNFAPTVTHNKSSKASLNFPPGININLKTTTYQLAFSTNWEVDIWGKLASSKRAAFATLLQSDAGKRAVQTQLIADIATYYYTLLALDKQLEITRQTIEKRTVGVETMKKLKASAIVNGAAVVQSESNLYAAEVSVPDILRSIRETENALSVLLGKEPSAITRASLDEQKVTRLLNTGVPAQLLQNRPDVASAELAFRSAFELTNMARTYFYPALTITSGNAGISSLATNNLFSNSIFYNIVGGLTQPIFNKWTNRARLKRAEATQNIAFNNFKQTLLKAGGEVSNALFSYQTSLEKQNTRAKQIASLEKAVDYTKQLLQYSSATNYTDVLTSEQSLLAAQLAGTNDELQRLQAVVSLYRALGGGWKNQ